MALRHLFILVVALAAVLVASAADTMTGVFDERIKSLQVRLDGNDFAAPVVVLGSSDRIRIDFDHLAEDREYFRYSLQHCDARWQPSGLVDSEFLDGFNEGSIEDYGYSQATVVHYVHYSLTIPNEEVAPTISGNYLLRIYRENEPDEPLLQCRFMVSEQTVPVSAFLTSRTDVDYNKAHQQLEICVDTERAGVEDIYNDLRVVVQQNGRLDSERALLRPLRTSGRKAYFEHTPELIFEGGNEYRRFETVSEYYPGIGVELIDFQNPYRHFYLFVDEPRADKPYLYDQTQHGRYFIRRQGAAESDYEADYGVVHFELDMPQISDGSMIFIDGDFVHRRFDPESEMRFNPVTQRYERAMLLKQGAYNYQYLLVPPGAMRGYTAPIEGDSYQTDNEYLIKIYKSPRGDRTDLSLINIRR
ncbi:MAG: DUF5103 domain-containing protein, partial [Muribaculaceae bacterium]|nr:DUF5103 domain-containing protein [Muribaculaceae bacterium]